MDKKLLSQGYGIQDISKLPSGKLPVLGRRSDRAVPSAFGTSGYRTENPLTLRKAGNRWRTRGLSRLPRAAQHEMLKTFSMRLLADVSCSPFGFDDIGGHESHIYALLSQFLADLNVTGSDREYDEAIYLLRRSGRYIWFFFKEQLLTRLGSRDENLNEDVSLQGLQSQEASSEDLVELWTARAGATSPERDFEDQSTEDSSYKQSGPDAEYSKLSIAAFDQHCKKISSSPEYHQLVAHISASLAVDWGPGWQMLFVESQLRILMYPGKWEHMETKKAVSFRVEVSIKAFLAEYYCNDDVQPLNSILALIGSHKYAQAVTWAEYMQQIWPKRGPELLAALQAAIQRSRSIQSSDNTFTLSNNVRVGIEIHEDHIWLHACENETILSELGCQLAWLCMAASTPDPSTTQALHSANVLLARTAYGGSLKFANVSPEISSIRVYARVSPTEPLPSTNASCWYSLFHNPVLIRGYPILRRPKRHEGLDIAFPAMVELGNAHYLTEFSGCTILKGFSSMFVATSASDGIIRWHFIVEPEGSYIPYSEALAFGERGLKGLQHYEEAFSAVRHFVGWTSETKRLIGTSEFKYNDIGWSRSSEGQRGMSLYRATITGGQFINAGVQLGPGNRNKRLREESKGGYREVIHQLRSHIRVNIFDQSTRRGWLVDGASALLLISRTQLTHDDSPYCRTKYLNIDNFEHCEANIGPDHAVHVLEDNQHFLVDKEPIEEIEELEVQNQVTEVKVNTTRRRILFHTLVRRNAEALFKAHAFCSQRKEEDSVQIKSPFTNVLEGWELLDFVGGLPTKQPFFQTLDSSGSGWLKLVRKIEAITLFASGLNMLLEPDAKKDPSVCCHWKNGPVSGDCLVTSVSLLKEINKRYGDENQKHFSPVPGVIWHQQSSLFEKCDCVQGDAPRCNRVQVLVSDHSLVAKSTPRPFDRINGAVIFGGAQSVSKLRKDPTPAQHQLLITPVSGSSSTVTSSGVLNTSEVASVATAQTSQSGSDPRAQSSRTGMSTSQVNSQPISDTSTRRKAGRRLMSWLRSGT